MKIGEAIRTVRIKLGLTQDEVSARAQLTQGFYSSIENGFSNPSLDALQRIASTFELPMFLLVWLAEDRKELTKKARNTYDELTPASGLTPVIDEIIAKK